MMSNLSVIFLVAKIFVIFGQEFSIKDYDVLNMEIYDSDLIKHASNVSHIQDKPALRYGFQRTGACKIFAKAFLCIRKCLDYNYDIAESDKYCKCKCYKNRVLSAYKQKKQALSGKQVTSWKKGIPSTRRPAWAPVPTTTVDRNSDIEDLLADNHVSQEAEISRNNMTTTESSSSNMPISESPSNNVTTFDNNNATTFDNHNATTFNNNNVTTFDNNNATTFDNNNATTFDNNNATTFDSNNATTFDANNATTFDNNNATTPDSLNTTDTTDVISNNGTTNTNTSETTTAAPALVP